MIEDLVERAYRDPRRMREVLEEAFERGKALFDPKRDAGVARAVAKKLRRRASVTAEFDGRSHMLELADEFDPPAYATATGARSGPTSSSASNERSGQR